MIASYRVREIFLLIASLGVSLVLVEVVLYFIGIQVPPYPPKTSRPELYQQYEPYGYRLRPSRVTTYRYPKDHPRELSVISNSDGFRSRREFDEADERVRLLVVGDSFVFGEGVEESERFTDVLETLEPRWRVDNLGMTGFGPGLMLRALEEVGLKTSPDVVIFCMYTDDFRRVDPYYAGAGFKIPRFKTASKGIVSIPYPRPHLWDRSRLFQAARHVYWRYTNAVYDLNEAILDRFLRLAETHQFFPVIVFLPGTDDLKVDKERRRRLSLYALRNQVPFKDLTAVLLADRGKKIFIKNNWHYNPLGHHIVAEEMSRFLAHEVLKSRIL